MQLLGLEPPLGKPGGGFYAVPSNVMCEDAVKSKGEEPKSELLGVNSYRDLLSIEENRQRNFLKCYGILGAP